MSERLKGDKIVNLTKLLVVIFYLVSFTLFTLIYLFSFHLRLLSGHTAFFYRGLKLLIIAIILTTIINLFLKKLLKVSWETFVAAILIAASIHLSFFIVFPVTFERSVTMYLLNTLNRAPLTQSCPGYQKGELENKLIEEYILKDKALDKRIKEQAEIGFIETKKNCVFITNKTRNLLRFSRLMKRLYNLN